MEGFEQLPLLGKVGLLIAFAFAVLWSGNKLLTAFLQNYEKMVDAQIRLNESIKSLVVPELQKIGTHLHLLATEENATNNKKELTAKIDELSKQLLAISSILGTRSNNQTQELK